MRAIEASILVMRLILVLLSIPFQLVRIDSANRLAEVSINIRIGEIYLL